MAAIPQVRKTGPRTYVPAEQILGGQVVEARAASRVGVAAAGSLKVLGVAVTDGINPEAFVGTSTVVNGLPTLNAVQLPGHVVVADSGIEVPVTYAAAAAFGDRLIAGAAGTVTPAGLTPDARSVVGICSEPNGVAINATGLVRTL
ncbi:MAG: hypothetical protein ACR2JO_08040 [Mycobacteriales bacterium]